MEKGAHEESMRGKYGDILDYLRILPRLKRNYSECPVLSFPHKLKYIRSGEKWQLY
jgi:hypothetical protein